jgi:hypothetical protein
LVAPSLAAAAVPLPAAAELELLLPPQPASVPRTTADANVIAANFLNTFILLPPHTNKDVNLSKSGFFRQSVSGLRNKMIKLSHYEILFKVHLRISSKIPIYFPGCFGEILEYMLPKNSGNNYRNLVVFWHIHTLL